MEQKTSVKIVVATHKKYRMPEDEMYIPLLVGAEGKEYDFGYQRDDTGDNISAKNSSFCELTGLYWAWKNVDADYIGLVHYRRHFVCKKNKDIWKRVLTYQDIEPYLKSKDIFVPKKRRYYIESLYSHYAHTHYAEHLDKTREVIRRKCPEYLNCFDRVMKQTSGYMFNMFIVRKNLLDSYCTWLFDVLFELEKKVDLTGLSEFQKRCFGRISELLFNVWLEYQLERNVVQAEQIKKFRWGYMEPIRSRKKIQAFLFAKFCGKRYRCSF